MQKVIVENKNKEDGSTKRAPIHLLGHDFYICWVTDAVGNILDEGELSIPKFTSSEHGEVFPACHVIAYKNTDGAEMYIKDLSDFGKLFQLGEKYTLELENKLLELAGRLKLGFIPKENALVVIPLLQLECINQGMTLEEMSNMGSKADFEIATSSMGVSTLLAEAVQVGVSLFDKLYCSDYTEVIANILSKTRRVGADGEPTNITVATICDMLDAVKSYIKIQN